MGCSDSRTDITAEEATVANAEAILEYSHLPAYYTDLIHRKYSYEGKIVEDQWKDIYKTLDLAPNKSYAMQSVVNFFDNFKIGPGEYSLKKLLVLGILLSKGSSEEKARLLFEVQDEAGSGILTTEGLDDLIKLMLDISIEINTKIKIKDDINQVTEEDIRRYVAKLRRGVGKAQSTILETILDGSQSITVEEFIRKMSHSTRPELLTAQGLRKFSKSCAENPSSTDVVVSNSS